MIHRPMSNCESDFKLKAIPRRTAKEHELDDLCGNAQNALSILFFEFIVFNIFTKGDGKRYALAGVCAVLLAANDRRRMVELAGRACRGFSLSFTMHTLAVLKNKIILALLKNHHHPIEKQSTA